MSLRSCRTWLLVGGLSLLSVGPVACLDLSQFGGGGGGGGLLGPLGNEPAQNQGGLSLPSVPSPDALGRDDDHRRDDGDRDKHGRTRLHEAAEEGKEGKVRDLLNHGAVLDARDEDGRTPLHLAAREGKLEVVKMLVRAGANVWAQDRNGKRPSELAHDKDHDQTSRYLRDAEQHRR